MVAKNLFLRVWMDVRVLPKPLSNLINYSGGGPVIEEPSESTDFNSNGSTVCHTRLADVLNSSQPT